MTVALFDADFGSLGNLPVARVSALVLVWRFPDRRRQPKYSLRQIHRMSELGLASVSVRL